MSLRSFYPEERLLHKGESLCCFRDSASVTYGGMLPSDLTLSALRFILSAKSRQSCKQDCETVDFCNSPEEIGKRHGANDNFPRSQDIKVRKNEMKLRKKEIKVPKNSSVPRWIIHDLHRGIGRFPR